MSQHGGHTKGGHAKAEGKRRGPWFVVFVVALVIFIASLVALGVIWFSYWQGQQKYGEAVSIAGLDTATLDEVQEGAVDSVTVDWDALSAVNPDVVAWVYVPGTPINYPVVQGRDNDEYLTVDFDRDAGWLANYGAIFLDYRNKPDFSDKANFVYGHHMNDGSMFAELARFNDQARFDECRTVYLLTPGGNMTLRTIALLHVNADDPLVQNEFTDDEDFEKYVKDKYDRSVVTVSDAPGADEVERVFAFATCDDFGGGRYVLFCYPASDAAGGLSGSVGIATEDGAATGFEDDLAEDSSSE